MEGVAKQTRFGTLGARNTVEVSEGEKDHAGGDEEAIVNYEYAPASERLRLR
jgi:hypothetical protein